MGNTFGQRKEENLVRLKVELFDNTKTIPIKTKSFVIMIPKLGNGRLEAFSQQDILDAVGIKEHTGYEVFYSHPNKYLKLQIVQKEINIPIGLIDKLVIFNNNKQE
ncbi:hypothetical protein ABK040_000234 [Willaertia magna]